MICLTIISKHSVTLNFSVATTTTTSTMTTKATTKNPGSNYFQKIKDPLNLK